jgi:hypothetical protein
MLRRFPDRYPHREDLPNEEEVLGVTSVSATGAPAPVTSP